MLADPDRVHTQLLRIDGLRQDIGDALVRASAVVAVVVVAEREVAEFHFSAFNDHSPFVNRVSSPRSRNASSSSAISRPSMLPSAATSSPKYSALLCSASAML